MLFLVEINVKESLIYYSEREFQGMRDGGRVVEEIFERDILYYKPYLWQNGGIEEHQVDQGPNQIPRVFPPLFFENDRLFIG